MRLKCISSDGKVLLYLDNVYASASAKPMCTFDEVRVDWARIRIYGARDAIDDACSTSSSTSLTPSPLKISHKRVLKKGGRPPKNY